MIPGLLAGSLVCNVTALAVPFLRVDIFLKGEQVYSLPRSAYLMWESGLYVIAALVVVFSIIFPFAKLATLGLVWLKLKDAAQQRVWLNRIEPLGKWSFLDVFVVCIILVLTNDQFFVSAEPVVGLYFFIAAIAMSMTCGSLIAKRVGSSQAGSSGVAVRLASAVGWHRWAVPLLLLLWGVALAAATVFPYIRVDQLFSGYTYSILDSALAMPPKGAYVVAVVAGVTLIGVPFLQWLGHGVFWLGKLSPTERVRWQRRLHLCGQWAMLDVFGLALLVFLLEGKSFVKTETAVGLYVLVGAIAINLISVAAVKVVAKRRVAGVGSGADD